MAQVSPAPSARLDVATWSDVSSRDALRLIAASVAQMVGFEVAVISMVHESTFVSVAVEGGDEVREALAADHTPVALVESEIAHADDWGRFQFIPHERNGFDILNFGWVPEIEPITGRHAWHPHDMLLAPLYDGEGSLAGLLSIDVPINGTRPDATQRELLERYAAQAERALLIAYDREALAQRVRLAESTRQVVRFAVSQPDIERALDDCRFALLKGFRADDLTIRTYAVDDIPEAGSPPLDSPLEVDEIVHRVARTCWTDKRAGILSHAFGDETLVTAAEHRVLTDFVDQIGYPLTMLVPIGAGTQCLGHLILFRKDGWRAWSADEQSSCFEVASDIGQAVLSSRNQAREQRLVTELRRLASYKTELLSTVSHELKNPLSVITGHLEILDAADDLSDGARFSVTAMERAATRLGRVVDSLLLLAEAGDPDGPMPTVALDVRPLLSEAADLAHVAAVRRDLTIELDVPPTPLLARGDVEQLDRVVTNLVSNAVKYTPRGGTISLGAHARDSEVELVVADEGIGISEADQALLFTEFFRSSNPEALAQPGTGLGLAICSRITTRHGGRIEVESRLGHGSTFRVFLPRSG